MEDGNLSIETCRQRARSFAARDPSNDPTRQKTASKLQAAPKPIQRSKPPHATRASSIPNAAANNRNIMRTSNETRNADLEELGSSENDQYRPIFTFFHAHSAKNPSNSCPPFSSFSRPFQCFNSKAHAISIISKPTPKKPRRFNV